MRYADANLFIYAALSGEWSEACTKYLRENSTELATAPLTVDEILWAIGKYRPRSDAIEFCKRLLASSITILPVDGETARNALTEMEEAKLKPRDAFHAAVMRKNSLVEIVSNDGDFDSVEGITRTWVT